MTVDRSDTYTAYYIHLMAVCLIFFNKKCFSRIHSIAIKIGRFSRCVFFISDCYYYYEAHACPLQAAVVGVGKEGRVLGFHDLVTKGILVADGGVVVSDLAATTRTTKHEKTKDGNLRLDTA